MQSSEELQVCIMFVRAQLHSGWIISIPWMVLLLHHKCSALLDSGAVLPALPAAGVRYEPTCVRAALFVTRMVEMPSVVAPPSLYCCAVLMPSVAAALWLCLLPNAAAAISNGKSRLIHTTEGQYAASVAASSAPNPAYWIMCCSSSWPTLAWAA